MLVNKTNLPYNLSSLISYLSEDFSDLRLKPKSYFVNYISILFCDLLRKSSSISLNKNDEITNYQTTLSFSIFYHYTSLPYYPCKLVYTLFSPMTLENFSKFIHTVYFGNLGSLLQLTFDLVKQNNSNVINVNDIKSMLFHFHINSMIQPDDSLLQKVFDGFLRKINSKNEINFDEWNKISQNTNPDLFAIIVCLLFKFSGKLNQEVLSFCSKIKTSDKVSLHIEWETKPSNKLSINEDISKDLFTYLKKILGYKGEYHERDVDELDNDSYDSDFETLNAFESDKNQVLRNLYRENLGLDTIPKKPFGTQLPMNINIEDTIITTVNDKITQTLILPGEQLNFLKGLNKKGPDVFKCDCLMLQNKKNVKVKLYIVDNELFVLSQDKKFISLIFIHKDDFMYGAIRVKEDEFVKDIKYTRVKLYNLYIFYIQEKSKAKEFVKYINKKIEPSNKTDLNIEANNKELIKGKYQIDTRYPIYEIQNKIKIYKARDIYDSIKLKKPKELLLKKISKEEVNYEQENYFFDIMKCVNNYLSKHSVEYIEPLKPCDKFEDTEALYLIYQAQESDEENNKIKYKLKYMRSFVSFIYLLHEFGMVLNIEEIITPYSNYFDLVNKTIVNANNIKVILSKEEISHVKKFGYSSSEVLKGEKSDKTIDIWYIGNVLFYIINKKLPFWDDKKYDNAKIYHNVLNNKVVFNNNDFSVLNDLILKCLDSDMKKRPNCAEILKIIDELIKGIK